MPGGSHLALEPHGIAPGSVLGELGVLGESPHNSHGIFGEGGGSLISYNPAHRSSSSWHIVNTR